jgi:hypothetical protein
MLVVAAASPSLLCPFNAMLSNLSIQLALRHYQRQQASYSPTHWQRQKLASPDLLSPSSKALGCDAIAPPWLMLLMLLLLLLLLLHGAHRHGLLQLLLHDGRSVSEGHSAQLCTADASTRYPHGGHGHPNTSFLGGMLVALGAGVPPRLQQRMWRLGGGCAGSQMTTILPSVATSAPLRLRLGLHRHMSNAPPTCSRTHWERQSCKHGTIRT